MIHRQCFISWIGLVLFLALPAWAAPILYNGEYLIQMGGSQLTVTASRSEQGAHLELYDNCSDAMWRLYNLGENVYRITSHGLAMDLPKAKRGKGAPVVISPWNESHNQMWKVVKSGTYYSLINVRTGLALELDGNQRKAGRRLHGSPRNKTDAQRFAFKPVNLRKN